MRLYGCHVSAAGGLENCLKNGDELGVSAIQIHATPPQRWNTEPYPKEKMVKYLDIVENSGVKAVFFHAIYLINLATPDEEKLEKAKLSLKHMLDLNAKISGHGVIVHVGSLKDQPSWEAGKKQVVSAIDWIIKNSDPTSRLLLEVAAGAGKVIGAKFEELREIYDELESNQRVGFALDTQHMWASGYDIRESEDLVDELEKVFGIERIELIHLNDSMTTLGSNRDRHANLGEGEIGLNALKHFVNHPKMKDIPVVLETPAMKTIETAKEEVKVLNKLI